MHFALSDILGSAALRASGAVPPLAFVKVNPAGEVPTEDSYVLPTYIRTVAHAAVLRYVGDHYAELPDMTAAATRDLAEAVCDALAPHFEVKDRRVTELYGLAQRFGQDLAGITAQSDVDYERTRDAADGAEWPVAWGR